MGCYGIGVSRLMGVIAEVLSDDKGLVWPEEVAPAKAIIIQLGDKQTVNILSEKLYKSLTTAGIEVLYDDRDLSAGQKFADADLTGIPYRVVLSEKTADKGKYEIKGRTQAQNRLLDHSGILQVLKS